MAIEITIALRIRINKPVPYAKKTKKLKVFTLAVLGFSLSAGYFYETNLTVVDPEMLVDYHLIYAWAY